MKTLTLVAAAALASVAAPTLLVGATVSITKSVELQASLQTPIFTSSHWVGPTIPARGGGYFLVADRTNGCALLRLAAAGNIVWEQALPVCNLTIKLLEQADGGVLALMGSRLLGYGPDGTVTLDRAVEPVARVSHDQRRGGDELRGDHSADGALTAPECPPRGA